MASLGSTTVVMDKFGPVTVLRNTLKSPLVQSVRSKDQDFWDFPTIVMYHYLFFAHCSECHVNGHKSGIKGWKPILRNRIQCAKNHAMQTHGWSPVKCADKTLIN